MTHAPALAPLVGALLVGGDSRRFGRPKQLVEWRGVSLGERVARALTAVAGDVVLAGGGAVAPALATLARAPDAERVRGPLAGIAGALAARPGRAVLAAACDQPLLVPEALAWLVGERRQGTLATVARLAPGGIEPLPGIYEPEIAPVLAALVAGGGSLQPLAGRDDVRVVTPPAALAVAWTSVDTPEALARLDAAGGARAGDPGDGTHR